MCQGTQFCPVNHNFKTEDTETIKFTWAARMEKGKSVNSALFAALYDKM
jgi:hypothetical protein